MTNSSCPKNVCFSRNLIFTCISRANSPPNSALNTILNNSTACCMPFWISWRSNFDSWINHCGSNHSYTTPTYTSLLYLYTDTVHRNGCPMALSHQLNIRSVVCFYISVGMTCMENIILRERGFPPFWNAFSPWNTQSKSLSFSFLIENGAFESEKEVIHWSTSTFGLRSWPW